MNKQPIVARPFHYICHIPFLVRTERVSSIHLNNRRLHHVCRWRSDRKDDVDLWQQSVYLKDLRQKLFELVR